MATVEAFNTGLTETHLAEAFSRALSDYTDAQIDAMLGGKQDNLTSAQLSAVNSGIDGARVEQYNETVTLEAEDRASLVELTDSGAKNLMKITTASQTINGVDFTVNSDGTVSANGTATAHAVFYLTTLQPLSNELVLSGTPSNGSITSYCMQVRTSAQSVLTNDLGEGVTITGADPTQTYRFCIRIANEYTANNLIFKPMLCTKAAWDISQAFVPYRPNYDKLIARIEALESGGTQSVSTLATLSKSVIADDSEDLEGYAEDTTDTDEENDTAVEDEEVR